VEGAFGLVGMRERIASLDGSLTVESKPGTGTRITAEIPVSA
jgi:signal transduction histidine kinase